MSDSYRANRGLCPNESHGARKAAVRLSWPSGRWQPTTACRSCLRDQLAVTLGEGLAILIEPVSEAAMSP